MPWVVGGLFIAQLVLNPFVASFRPGEYAEARPLRWLPVELTLVNDLPINTDAVARACGSATIRPISKDPGLPDLLPRRQRVHREADKSFWVKGESRAEFLVKARPRSIGR